MIDFSDDWQNFKSYKAVSSEMAFIIWRARVFWSDYVPGPDISTELISTEKKKERVLRIYSSAKLEGKKLQNPLAQTSIFYLYKGIQWGSRTFLNQSVQQSLLNKWCTQKRSKNGIFCMMGNHMLHLTKIAWIITIRLNIWTCLTSD